MSILDSWLAIGENETVTPSDYCRATASFTCGNDIQDADIVSAFSMVGLVKSSSRNALDYLPFAVSYTVEFVPFSTMTAADLQKRAEIARDRSQGGLICTSGSLLLERRVAVGDSVLSAVAPTASVLSFGFVAGVALAAYLYVKLK